MWALIINDSVYELTKDDPSGKFPPDFNWVECSEGVREGSTYLDGEFSPQEDPTPTLEQITIEALSRRDGLMGLAALRIAPLQDAVDLDDAEPEGIASLRKWKQYRVALNRIHDQSGFPKDISWPEQPN